MRLASQRQKIEDEQEVIDTLTEEELMAYEVARESLGEGAAYNLEMDNPLPAARMQLLNSTSSIKGKIIYNEKSDRYIRYIVWFKSDNLSIHASPPLRKQYLCKQQIFSIVIV